MHDDCDDSLDMEESLPFEYMCPKCRDDIQVDTETSSPVLPSTVEIKDSDTTKDVPSLDRQPAKRTSMSSSLDSNTSSAALKGKGKSFISLC